MHWKMRMRSLALAYKAPNGLLHKIVMWACMVLVSGMAAEQNACIDGVTLF